MECCNEHSLVLSWEGAHKYVTDQRLVIATTILQYMELTADEVDFI